MATVAHQMFHAFEDTYNTYKDGRDVEMEMRLGKKNMNGIFDTNIPQAQWTSEEWFGQVYRVGDDRSSEVYGLPWEAWGSTDRGAGHG